MILTEHFTEAELNVDGAEQRIRSNALWLCIALLEPIRSLVGSSIVITSGYRPPALNAAVGGVATSEHEYQGDHAAADFVTPDYPLAHLFDQIRESGLPFRQLILETNKDGIPECIHISTRRALDKHEALMGQTHGTGSYTLVSCAPVIEMAPDPSGAISGVDG